MHGISKTKNEILARFILQIRLGLEKLTYPFHSSNDFTLSRNSTSQLFLRPQNERHLWRKIEEEKTIDEIFNLLNLNLKIH